jgi:NAD(P)-dependent dehydrogenase (short-subunit alcohol dehydrogenase family)
MSNDSLATTFDFSGRRALVTGGTRGFGALLSKRLAEHGAHVYLNYVRDDNSAKRTLEEIEQAGGSGTLVKANLVHAAEIDAMFEIVTAGGHLNILVHNARRARQPVGSHNVGQRAGAAALRQARGSAHGRTFRAHREHLEPGQPESTAVVRRHRH